MVLELRSLGDGVESRDGFDQTGDGESVTDAPGFANQMELAAFAIERDGHANQCGDAGAVDLRNPVEINDHAARAVLKNGSEREGQLVAGLANSEASVQIEDLRAMLFAMVNLNRRILGHIFMSGLANHPESVPCHGSQNKPEARCESAVHYTMRRGGAGK